VWFCCVVVGCGCCVGLVKGAVVLGFSWSNTARVLFKFVLFGFVLLFGWR
jgi:hypothetical protein